LSVRETEEYVKNLLTPKPEKIKEEAGQDKSSAAITLSAKEVERKLTNISGRRSN
jgi:hypothetical protein